MSNTRYNIILPLNSSTMEAYTSHGGKLWELLDYNTKYLPFLDKWLLLWQGRPNMEGRTWLVTFKGNRVKLKWAFMNIMNVVCTSCWNFAQWLIKGHHVAFWLKAHYGDPLWVVTLYYFSKMCMFKCIPFQTFEKIS